MTRPVRSRAPGVISVVALPVALALVSAQGPSPFTDAAGRRVQVPSAATRLFAAGAPAEVLLYTLAPDRLVGRNRIPEGDAIEFFPPELRSPVFIRQLPEVDNPAADAELLALKPDLYVDYGTVNEDYIASVDAVQRRTGVPGIILDGALSRIPDTYRRLGRAIGLAERGERLASAADAILTRYRGMLATTAPRVYLACSADGSLPCVEDESGGEQLRWLGGINVAGTRATAPRRPLSVDDIRKLSPDIIVLAGGALRLRASAEWQTIPAAAGGRVYQWPAFPYNWGARPPSVNRLPGLMWLAYVARGRAFDAEFARDVRAFFADFYHLTITDAQLQRLVAQ